MSSGKRTVLVIAAHPDDELLGLGGTVINHVKNGDEVYSIILGEGQTSRWTNRSDASSDVVESLHKDSVDAANILGVKKVLFANFPDNRFDQVDLLDIVKKVEETIEAVKPDIIYTHYKNDLNIDHRMTYQAVLTATRPMQGEGVTEIYSFETLSASEWNFQESYFAPNYFVDISESLEDKVKAMECYKSELREWPHPRSSQGIRTLAAFRGMQCGYGCAEGFEVVRCLASKLTSGFSLRSVNDIDSGLLYAWANDEDVRKNAFNTQPIAWNEHCTWFAKKMHDSKCSMYIFQNDRRLPLGQIRGDIVDGKIEIDYSIDKNQRGKGYGKKMLELFIEKSFGLAKTIEFIAKVKIENVASQKCFEACGFDKSIYDSNFIQYTKIIGGGYNCRVIFIPQTSCFEQEAAA